ncbi:MAG: sel1 repeat family protein [Betaproteobacteria bacterium]|nr:sel1 repeat family protein [Betaproteobacteria bacterium]MCL2887204.1 sel1 repeat family protein [Betaproteobacteria bacterium]
MRLTLISLSLAALGLVGCAAQTPEEQLTPRPTVRVCSGNQCADQPSNITTFQDEPSDPEAERRMAELIAMAETNPKAAYDVGLRLLRGDGVQRNTYQAIEWMRKAGDRGDGAAQFALGRLYLLGFEEMGSDPAEAEAWLSRAAAKGNEEAKRLLPQAQAAKREAQDKYQERKDLKETYETMANNTAWVPTLPYNYAWSSSGWRQQSGRSRSR